MSKVKPSDMELEKLQPEDMELETDKPKAGNKDLELLNATGGSVALMLTYGKQ